MTQVKQLDFRGTTIYCGVDVHKESWRVNIQDKDFELEDFTQNADAALLLRHLSRKYPGAEFKVCYEAGFSGFGAQRFLAAQGIECLVVNAADVATNDKERRRKSDKSDARKLCEHLQTRKARGIYVPSPEWEQARSLVRARYRLVSNQTRAKNRIWQLLHFSGIAVPQGYEAGRYWSRRFVESLKSAECGGPLKTTLELYIKDFEQTRGLLLQATRAVRKLCRQPEHEKQIDLLRSLPSIGEVLAAVVLFELQDIRRFQRFDNLCSYAGLVPDSEDSGEKKHPKGITHRHNPYLRQALVEASWMVIRKDPAMLMKYKQYCRHMDRNKAIIRIAKHLLARIRYVLLNQKEYVPGVVG